MVEDYNPFDENDDDLPEELKDDFSVDLDDIPDFEEFEPGVYRLIVTKVRSSGAGAKKAIEFSFEVADGEHKGKGARDRIDLSQGWHRERLKKFGRAVEIQRNEKGRWDFSEGAILGKTVDAWMKFDTYFDCMRPSRYTKPAADPSPEDQLR